MSPTNGERNFCSISIFINLIYGSVILKLDMYEHGCVYRWNRVSQQLGVWAVEFLFTCIFSLFSPTVVDNISLIFFDEVNSTWEFSFGATFLEQELRANLLVKFSDHRLNSVWRCIIEDCSLFLWKYQFNCTTRAYLQIMALWFSRFAYHYDHAIGECD